MLEKKINFDHGNWLVICKAPVCTSLLEHLHIFAKGVYSGEC